MVVVTDRFGREQAFDKFHIHGKRIRFVHIPSNQNMWCTADSCRFGSGDMNRDTNASVIDRGMYFGGLNLVLSCRRHTVLQIPS